jgi:phosphoenolpyruvate-protein kinase (PTS system EI component)
VRSELLLPDDLGRPNAEHYRREFAALLDLAAPLSVTVRLLDLAVDKWPTWLVDADADAARRRRHGSQLYDERSIRELVDAQLTALAALGTPERLRLIWPSGARLTDFLLWHDDAQRWLPDIALGAMVESPLEMLALECWQAAADFVAVGCNDLLQHLSAADRDDLGQRRLLDPYRPELFRFLAHAVQSASLDPARLQLCGLLPQIDGVLPVLVGLGCRCFSGGPTLIPLLAQVLADRTLTDCKALAAGVCAADSSTAVRELLGVDAGTPWGLVRDNAGASG